MRKLLPTALLILFTNQAVAASQAVLPRKDIDRLNKELLFWSKNACWYLRIFSVAPLEQYQMGSEGII